MSNPDIRREIEKLRALLDSMTATRQKANTAELPAGEPSASRAEENAAGNAALNGQTSKAHARHKPAIGGQNSAVAGCDGSTGSQSTQIAQWTFVLAVTFAILIVGRTFLVPLAVALLLLNLLNALAGAFGRIRLGRRSLPKWLAWTFALVALLLANALVYWILISQSEALSAAAPVYQANFDKLASKLTVLLGIEKMPSTTQLMESLDLGALLTWLGGSVGSTLSELVLVALYVAFLLVEQRYFPAKIARLSSNEENAAKTRTLISAISKQIQTYIWLKTVVSLLTGFVSYVVLRLSRCRLRRRVGLNHLSPQLHTQYRVVNGRNLSCASDARPIRDPHAFYHRGAGFRCHAVCHREYGRARVDGELTQSQFVCHHPVADLLGHDLGNCRDGSLCPDNGLRCDCLLVC